MSDSSITLNLGTGGAVLDTELVGGEHRERIQVTGSAAAEVARIVNAEPAADDYGLVVRVVPPPMDTAAVTSVSGAITAVTLLVANSDRRSFYIHNDSSAVLWVKFGTAASATSYTVELIAGAFERFEYPAYTGLVTGIWETATGAARLTEVT